MFSITKGIQAADRCGECSLKEQHGKIDNSRGRLRGFTIVELLVVIVVIAILAAITIVAYNGIQMRANDSARASEADGLKKKIDLYQVDSSTYGYGSAQPATRDDFVDLYKIQALSNRSVICGYDACPSGTSENWDKSKLYVRAWFNEIVYGYWSNADSKWHNADFYDGDSEYDSTSDGPVYLYSNGGVPT